MCISATANKPNRQKQSESIGKSSLNPAKTRVWATGGVKLPRFDASVRKSAMGRDGFDSRLSASEAVSVLQSVAVLAGYMSGVDLGPRSQGAVAP